MPVFSCMILWYWVYDSLFMRMFLEYDLFIHARVWCIIIVCVYMHALHVSLGMYMHLRNHSTADEQTLFFWAKNTSLFCLCAHVHEYAHAKIILEWSQLCGLSFPSCEEPHSKIVCVWACKCMMSWCEVFYTIDVLFYVCICMLYMYHSVCICMILYDHMHTYIHSYMYIYSYVRTFMHTYIDR